MLPVKDEAGQQVCPICGVRVLAYLEAHHAVADGRGDIPLDRFIAPRIEQFDRETQAPRKVFDTISDFAANAGIVLGGRPVRPLDVDLRWVGALLHKNGVVEETGLAAGVLNHPANGVAWLANKLAPHGEGLKAGDVVLAGSFTRPTTAVRGDNLHADYGPLGSISFRFV